MRCHQHQADPRSLDGVTIVLTDEPVLHNNGAPLHVARVAARAQAAPGGCQLFIADA